MEETRGIEKTAGLVRLKRRRGGEGRGEKTKTKKIHPVWKPRKLRAK